MEESFGARLRAQRERQQITLEAIAERTKIRRPLLDALERDDLSQWPSGIFRRAYFRSYAAAIGLDPEDAVREFLTHHPDLVEDANAALEAALGEGSARRPRIRLQYLIESAIGALHGQKQEAPPDALAAPIAKPPGAVPSAVRETIAPVEAVQPVAGMPETPRRKEFQPDLPSLAALCTRVAQAKSAADVVPLMSEAARVLNADGLILWLWNQEHARLWPSLSHGYSADTLAHLPAIHYDADNAIAAAFRSATPKIVSGGRAATGAIVVPILTPGGCSGVLALECSSGRECEVSLQALAGVLAAQLSILADATPATRFAVA